MLKPIVFILAATFISSAAFAQNNRNTRNSNTNGNTQGGVFSLPRNVDRMVALEHNNTIIAQTREDDGSKGYAALQLRHISPRALAYIFGATVIPTEALVMPPAFNNGFNNGANGAGGGQNFGFPGNNGFNNGNNGGNGFLFPQGNTNFGNGFNNGFGNGLGNGGGNGFNNRQPQANNGAGLGIGTPAGNFFLPAQPVN